MIKKKDSVYSWVVCVVISLYFFYEFAQATMLDSISVALMRDLNTTAVGLAKMSAYYFYSNIFLLIPAGIILSRGHTKIITCSAIIISVVGIFLLAIARTVHAAEVARFISGIGGAFCFLCCLQYVKKWFTFEKMSLAIGVIITIAFIGGITSHIPLAFLSSVIGWRSALLIFGLLGVAIFLINCLFLTDNDEVDSVLKEDFNIRSVYNDFKMVINNRYTWFGSIYVSLLNLPVIVLGSLWSGLFLQQIINLSAVWSAIISSGMFAGLIIGSPIVGFYAKDDNRIHQIMYFGAIFSTLLMIMLITYQGSSIPLLFSIFMLLGFFSSTQSVGYSVVINHNQQFSSLASSITSITVLGGGVCCKLLFGFLLDYRWTGIIKDNVRVYSAENFQIALSMIPIAFILCIAIAFLYKKSKSYI
jgi:MFS family permease